MGRSQRARRLESRRAKGRRAPSPTAPGSCAPGRATSNSSRDGALVHVGVLPQVERREMEAEHVDGASKRPQPAVRQNRRTVLPTRIREARRDRQGARRVGVGRRGTDRMAKHFAMSECPSGRGQARVHAGDGAPIRFVLALVGAVRRLFRRAREPCRRRRRGGRRATARRPAGAVRRGRSSSARLLCNRSARCRTSAVTKGLPSRSPPIQLPMRKNDGSSTPFHAASTAPS